MGAVTEDRQRRIQDVVEAAMRALADLPLEDKQMAVSLIAAQVVLRRKCDGGHSFADCAARAGFAALPCNGNARASGEGRGLWDGGILETV